MATRRIISNEKTFLDQDDPARPTQAGSPRSDITPAVPTDVILKLLGFTFAMIAFPIGSYFISVETIFKGNSTFAGALAAVMANVVLIAYVIVAMREDHGERQQQGKPSMSAEAKKHR